MKAITSVAAALGFAAGCCAAYPAAAAGKYDGSAALICSASVVHECAVGELCQPRMAESVGLPPLLRVDFKAMKVRHFDAARNRDSTISSVSSVNGRMVLHGGEGGRGWTVAIHQDTGRMTGAVATDGEGYLIFGQCMLP